MTTVTIIYIVLFALLLFYLIFRLDKMEKLVRAMEEGYTFYPPRRKGGSK